MSKPVIEVKQLSKVYTIGHEQEAAYGSLREEIMRVARMPLELLTGHRLQREQLWALKDVSFEVKPGEVMGIIGRNGSGKSTLLKVLSRIVEPTRGEAVLRGRSASLLEVGTGFHPELTGRENVFLNGAILGMQKREIQRKFDEIIAFSEVERFLDTPVKFYSSGMYVRLAFAVAAHLDPDILIVDEVLAVGDAEFQKKSLGKMNTVAKEGRTVLFVSHSMETIRNLCTNALLLDGGVVKSQGEVSSVIQSYIGSSQGSGVFERFTTERHGEQRIKIRKITLLKEGLPTTTFQYGDELTILLELDKASREVKGVRVDVNIFNDQGVRVACYSNSNHPDVVKGKMSLLVRRLELGPGDYSANISLHQRSTDLQDLIPHAIQFRVDPSVGVIPGVQGITYSDLEVK